MIKPIETVYKGYRFRSRLEARWAVFFDALKLEWQYEPEGFDLGDGLYYLPDFYLPQQKCFVEIKPDHKIIDETCFEKAGRLSAASDKWVDMICGIPGDEVIIGFRNGKNIVKQVFFGVCILCNTWGFMTHHDRNLFVQLKNNQTQEITVHEITGTQGYYGHCYNCNGAIMPETQHSNNYLKSYLAARQARFEHGETPRF